MKKIFIIAGLSLSIMTSCSKFEEINVNPNNPATVPAAMLLPPLISGAAGSMNGSAVRAGEFVQHLAGLGGNNEDNGRYNLTGASFREEWNAPMRLIKDVNQLKLIAKNPNQPQPQYEAIAYIMKVYILSLMSDAYGDIPYDEAGRGNEQSYEFPHYQSQQDVYKRMLEDLDTANQLLKNLPSTALITRDILFNGNASLWRKFANSLKIRILMRESAKVDVSAQVAAIFNNATEYPVFSSVADQATLVYNNTTDYYYWYIINHTSDARVDFASTTRVSDVMVDLLKSKNDPRLYIYAAPSQKSFNANKANPATPLEYRGLRVGYSAAEQKAHDDSAGINKDDYSVIGRRIRAENRSFLMTYAELLLLKAEAIQRGMGVSGDAATIYTEAVTASFNKWPLGTTSGTSSAPYVSDAQKTAYFSQPNVALQPATALQQIGEQLWIDAYLNGFEAWAGWRRTGIPALRVGPSVLSPIPVRYVYSDNEQNNPSLLEWLAETMEGKMPTHNTKVWFQP